ncbi:hypothetical protein [Luteimonas terrae]|uniref:hypothetical protein n=1 Tax=Luteimonas terrae TaxID=1530191 RepID=UPI000A9D7005|nr:hypothetical protein [Luteimonas terrae]
MYGFRWRVLLPTTIAIVIALSVYYLGDRTQVSIVSAFAIGVSGFVVGLVWTVIHRRFG